MTTPPSPSAVDCYDYPQYWDLAFRDETLFEADFVESAFEKYARLPLRTILEPGCGGGRLMVELAKRGYQVSGFDLSEPSVRYVQQRLRRRSLPGEVFVGDMTDFTLAKPVDCVVNFVNTFRHLTTEEAALAHLQHVAAALRSGGLFLLGFHLIPLDADPECTERSTARHGQTKVTLTLRVVDFNRRRRLERIRFNLRVKSGQRDLKLQSEYDYRLYTRKQFLQLLAKVPQLELCGTFDFNYDIDEPVPLDDELSDAVFVLRKRDE
ncbi:class I SAM-dependent methyltransferase [Blastopirellula sp. JC732]|uniref:Class I SAM-dependent methyltransferase n=1 Tax=Blastopirellula sediminis TaxID=2894196 RepID=A0A9X1MNW6_9BACT|nr:class I SAM-dependent methyltransferase [Blastopirellula sediminis]MCC9607047.1 class I SAM-dependent methyltransferase [Blastopirellula sediminis]MCC9629660.1 class I SAM-dependent methyltransferase [Blastopirellula sediminis]